MANVVRNMVNIMGISDNLPNTSKLYKQFSINDTVCLDAKKPDIERLISSAFDVQIASIRVINTPCGEISTKTNIPEIATSAEGENLTGKKLVVELKVKQKIQYVANLCDQSVHGVHNEFTVSEFIVIPYVFDLSSECVTPEYLLANDMFYIKPFIEDANVNMLSNRCFSTNLLIFLQVDTKQCFFDKGTVTTPISNVSHFNNICDIQGGN